MFGLFRPKWKRVALEVERLLMMMEAAYEQARWDVFVLAGRRYTELLGEIHVDPTLENAPVFEHLQARGKVKSLKDHEYEQKMREAQQRAGAFF